MNGYVYLFRKFTEWEWYKDQNTKDLFIHCLLKANWKDGKFEGIDVPRGSFITGRKKLATELGISEQQIRTALKHLISTSEITIKKTNKFSIITINNYGLYQMSNQENNQQLTNNQPTTNQQLTTNEKRNKEIKKKIYNNTFQNFDIPKWLNQKNIKAEINDSEKGELENILAKINDDKQKNDDTKLS